MSVGDVYYGGHLRDLNFGKNRKEQLTIVLIHTNNDILWLFVNTYVSRSSCMTICSRRQVSTILFPPATVTCILTRNYFDWGWEMISSMSAMDVLGVWISSKELAEYFCPIHTTIVWSTSLYLIWIWE